MAAIAIVAWKLVAVELVDHVPLYSHTFGGVTLGLANGMMETSLLSPSHWNGESTTMLRAGMHAVRARRHITETLAT